MGDLYSKTEYDVVSKEPCKCEICGFCGSTGTIWVNYDPLGRVMNDCGMDDLSELEYCDQCHYGITEVCDRCQILEDMDRDKQEHEERTRQADVL